MDQAKTLYGDTKVRPTYCHLILDPATEIRDDVHPTADGYNKMGLEVVNQINCWQNGK
jgi:lysophospholipase L1-like esterase